MRMGIALALVLACPTLAAAQYGFQLRPSPYRILSGWEQSANTGGGHATRAATPVSDRTEAGHVGMRQNDDSDVTGSVYRTQATHR